jgi:hypothetical protein
MANCARLSVVRIGLLSMSLSMTYMLTAGTEVTRLGTCIRFQFDGSLEAVDKKPPLHVV